MRTYHYSVIAGHGVQSPWLAVSQTYLSALFNFQRAVGESIGFHV
ncbi:hypothetical protein [Clostridioides difficile]|nr:hypothetical protein [Clostridioides difficile]